MRFEIVETVSGRFRRAEKVAVELEVGDPPDVSATLASWFLTCPGESPAWDRYMLGVIHLRPIDGVKPAAVRLEGATHEVMLCALDPQLEPSPDPSTWRPLTPLNVEHQLIVGSDDDAVELCELLARAVVDGRLWAEPPLSGQTEPWASVIDETAAHFRGEHD